MTPPTAKPDGPRLHVDVDVALDTWRDAVPGLEDICRAAAGAAAMNAGSEMARALCGRRAEACLRLTGDDEIEALNRDFRAAVKPTNVLSFPALSLDELRALPADAPALLGDVVVAYGVARREAGAEGKSLPDHLSHLIVHGMLHLLGYDHIEERDAVAMEGLETAILAGLGIADPHAESEAVS